MSGGWSAFGCRYYVLFVDVASRYNWVFPIERKLEVHNIFIQFKRNVEKLCNQQMKALQTDNIGEFLSLKSVLAEHRIAHRRSCPYTHQQMGMVEHRHRHIVDLGISLLTHAKMPLHFWYYAFLYNRVNSSALSSQSPFQKLFGQHPNLVDFKTFGCKIFPCLRPYQQHKFSRQSEPHVCLGYPQEHAEYVCFNPTNGKVIISKDVVCLEEDFDLNPHLTLTPIKVNNGNLAQEAFNLVLQSVCTRE